MLGLEELSVVLMQFPKNDVFQVCFSKTEEADCISMIWHGSKAALAASEKLSLQ